MRFVIAANRRPIRIAANRESRFKTSDSKNNHFFGRKKAHKHKLFGLADVQMALGQTAGCPRVNRAKKFMCSPKKHRKYKLFPLVNRRVVPALSRLSKSLCVQSLCAFFCCPNFAKSPKFTHSSLKKSFLQEAVQYQPKGCSDLFKENAPSFCSF